MRHPGPGSFRTLAAFEAHLAAIDPGFCLDPEALGSNGPFAQPFEVLGRSLDNRFACQPMEGWDGTSDGQPSELTLRRWQRFGASGAALVWGGEAYAVQHAGRANGNQLCRGAHTRDSLEQLLAALHEGALAAGGGFQLVGLQLTHSGRYARPDGKPEPRIAFRHPVLARRHPYTAEAPVLTDDELDGIGADFVRTAVLAQQAGFRFVDVKCCHGYLLHELLAARDRPGRYGGDFTARTRFHRQVIEAIRSACPGLGIAVRLSLADTVPYERDPATGLGRPMACELPYRWGFGVDARDPTRFDLDEPFLFLRLLQDLGVQLVNVTLGSPYSNPHVQRPAAYPPSDGYDPPEDPLRFVFAHLQVVRKVKAAFPALRLVGTGYTYLQEWLPHVAAHELARGHVDCIGLGRMLLTYPELPRDLLAGRPLQRKRICRTFSDCTTAPRNGMVSGCYPLDPFYASRPEAAKVKALNQERRQ